MGESGPTRLSSRIVRRPIMADDILPFFLANRAVRSSGTLEVRDKFKGTVAARVALPDEAAVEQAIAAAHDAQGAMRELPADRRRSILRNCAREIERRREAFIRLLVIESGKPLKDARLEVERAVETFTVAASEAVSPEGRLLDLGYAPRSRGTLGLVRRVPLGPASLITPFNFPLNLVAHKVAPAIAAGSAFLLKPSEKTPLTALLLGEILAATDLPPGAFSVLPLPGERSGPLVTDERIRLLSFTGGQAGWDLRARAGRKKVLLELGGNAACIVDEDQGDKLPTILPKLVSGSFAQSGQSCISIQRILVHASLYEAVREGLVAAARRLRMGDPGEESTDLGPLIDTAAAERVRAWIREAREGGARILCGDGGEGAFVPATVLEKVPRSSRVWREEVFGPVVVLESFTTFDQALAAVNDSDYGLQAGVFTDSLRHVERAWSELEVGGVVIGNTPNFRVDAMPYGGVKRSGVGREGLRSAVEEMTEPRLLVLHDEVN